HVGHQDRVARSAVHDSAPDTGEDAPLDVDPDGRLGPRDAAGKGLADRALHRSLRIPVAAATDDVHAADPWPRTRRSGSRSRATTVWSKVPYMPDRKMRSRPSS